MLHIFPSHKGRIGLALALIMAFFGLLSLSGCGNPTNDSLETYHNTDYGFSLSVDKELMKYIQVEEKVTDDTQEVMLDFYYYDEGTRLSSDGIELPYTTWGVFFTIFVEPVGTTPQDNHLQLMGSNEQYSFYFGTLYTPFENAAVNEVYEKYEEKIIQIPSTFSIDK